jgi:hypothetical protein
VFTPVSALAIQPAKSAIVKGFRMPALRLVCEGVNAEDDAFAFRGYVAYANELFRVSMRIHKNGDVEMLDDDPLGRIVRLH